MRTCSDVHNYLEEQGVAHEMLPLRTLDDRRAAAELSGVPSPRSSSRCCSSSTAPRHWSWSPATRASTRARSPRRSGGKGELARADEVLDDHRIPGRRRTALRSGQRPAGRRGPGGVRAAGGLLWRRRGGDHAETAQRRPDGAARPTAAANTEELTMATTVRALDRARTAAGCSFSRRPGRLDAAALEVLAEVGVSIPSDGPAPGWPPRGAVDGARVRLRPELVRELVALAPACLTLGARDGGTAGHRRALADHDRRLLRGDLRPRERREAQHGGGRRRRHRAAWSTRCPRSTSAGRR